VRFKMKKIKTDIVLLLLTLITFYIWYSSLSMKQGLMIYLLIFLFLLIKKKPISHYIVVILFSIMSISINVGYTTIEYILSTILFGLVILQMIRKREIVFGNIFFILLLYLSYNLLSLIWTPVLKDGWRGIISMLQGYMMYVIVTNGGFKVGKLDRITISKAATFIMLTLSLEIFYIYHSVGFEAALHSKGHIVLGWGYSNLIAVIYTFALPVAFYKYLHPKQYYPHYFVLDVLNVVGLVLTLSRGAIVGAAVALAIYTVFTFRKQFIIRYYSLVAILAFAVLRIKKLHFYIDEIKERFFRSEVLDDSGRFELYKLAYERFKTSPIFGDGIKSSKYFIQEVMEWPSTYYHNFILQIAATLGIIGLIFILIILSKLLFLFFKPRDLFVICMGLGVVASLIHQMLDINYDRIFFGTFMYAIVGLTELYRHYHKDDPFTLKKLSFSDLEKE
jgi:O-antigen ligase